jgi:hypothetical protein
LAGADITQPAGWRELPLREAGLRRLRPEHRTNRNRDDHLAELGERLLDAPERHLEPGPRRERLRQEGVSAPRPPLPQARRAVSGIAILAWSNGIRRRWVALSRSWMNQTRLKKRDLASP